MRCGVYAPCEAFGSCNENQPFCNCLTGFQPTSQQNWNQQVYSGGRVRKTKLWYNNASVGVKRGDQFFESHYTTFPTHPQNRMVVSNMECKSTCIKKALVMPMLLRTINARSE
ncbi:hypothetical protein V6N12_010617 [Hibiscus sabdariffa]|uniref:S-locus glycoprotein domain-containing protein n=1 Tax=Hibiscus sabdariffa TaxID=183260 RepID=A0ABR2EKL5_9ROSI